MHSVHTARTKNIALTVRSTMKAGKLSSARPTSRRGAQQHRQDRKSTRLNSSHLGISYAVFCLKKKKKKQHSTQSQKKKRKPIKLTDRPNRRPTTQTGPSHHKPESTIGPPNSRDQTCIHTSDIV